VQFVNLLDPDGSKDGSTTRNAAVHIQGLELRDIKGDGSFAGNNPSSFVPPVTPQQACLPHYFAKEEGSFFLYSIDDGNVSQYAAGLFGSVNVQPDGASITAVR